MVRRRWSILTSVILSGMSPACSSGWDDLSIGTAADYQSCAESALRSNPDPEILPAAFEDFSRDCERGENKACSMLGLMYERGLATERNYDKAVSLYSKACTSGNAGGCFNLVMIGREMDIPASDPFHASRLLTFACERDHPQGCRELARMYQYGNGVEQDLQRAGQLHERACDGGDGGACYELARMHDAGGGLAMDTLTAVTKYEQACAGGYQDGCNRLTELLAAQTAPKRAEIPAPERDCLAGDGSQCAAAAVIYARGEGGVNRDMQRVVTLFGKACELGYEASCHVVKPMLAGACARGDDESCQMLKRVAWNSRTDGGPPVTMDRGQEER